MYCASLPYIYINLQLARFVTLRKNKGKIYSQLLTARLTTTIDSLLSSTGHFSEVLERTQLRQNVCYIK